MSWIGTFRMVVMELGSHYGWLPFFTVWLLVSKGIYPFIYSLHRLTEGSHLVTHLVEFSHEGFNGGGVQDWLLIWMVWGATSSGHAMVEWSECSTRECDPRTSTVGTS